MPLLINRETGIPERIEQEKFHDTLSAKTHQIPLISPEGEHALADSLEQADQSIKEGYKYPNVNQLQELIDYAKNDRSEEQAKAFAEGLASSATFGTSTAVEKALGVKSKDIERRSETLPHTIGEVGGLLIPGAAGSKIAKAGEKTAQAFAKLAGESTLAKIGSTSAKLAVESALVQSENEVSKFFTTQANAKEAIGTAMANIGLTGAIGAVGGAALGTVSPLWKATAGPKLTSFLDAFSKRVNGEGLAHIEPEISEAIKKSGLNVPPEVVAAVSKDANLVKTFQYLQESRTFSGQKAQEAYKNFQNEAKNAVVEALGKTGQEIEGLSDLSKYERGREVQSKIVEELRPEIQAFDEGFGEIEKAFSKEKLPEIKDPYGDVKYSSKDELIQKLAELERDAGYLEAPDSVQAKEIKSAMKGVRNLETLEGLRNYQTTIQNTTWGNLEKRFIGQQIKHILREEELKIISNLVESKAPHLGELHQGLRSRYGEFKDFLGELNGRLKVGKYHGAETFIEKLESMGPEELLKRLTRSDDAGLLELVKAKLPRTAELLKDQFLNGALKQSIFKGEFSPNRFFKIIDSWSPELKSFALPEQSLERLGALQAILEKLPGSGNPSGSATMFEQLTKHERSGGVGAMISYLLGHGVAKGFIVGTTARLIAREGQDAAKLSLLRFMGSDAPLSSTGFKVMSDWIHAVQKGNRAVNSSVKKLFHAGTEVAPTLHDQDKAKVEKKIGDFAQNPQKLLDVAGDTGHYLPEYATALGEYAARSINYLNSIKPQTTPAGVLDEELPINPVQEAKYARALHIADQPLVTLDYLKAGMLTSEDIQTLNSVHPELYESLRNKIVNELISQKSKGTFIPYQMRLGLSVFLGQPLESTMTPFSIQTSQAANSMTPKNSESQMQASQGHKINQNAAKSVGKYKNLVASPLQNLAIHSAMRRGG